VAWGGAKVQTVPKLAKPSAKQRETTLNGGANAPFALPSDPPLVGTYPNRKMEFH